MAAAVSCLTLASIAVVPALADQWNKKTIITISEAVQVPGAVLQPGKYVMRLLESQADRHIVQIFNEREDQLQTTILAIPNYRLQPTGKTEFQWWETPAGQPKAMRAWFYPGDNFGQEFAYPKNTAMQIASNSSTATTVPTVSGEDLSKATVASVDKSGSESELNKETYTAQTAPAPAPTPAPEVAQNTAPAPAPQAAEPAPVAQDTGTRARTEDTLPKTASPFPMAGLAGFFALGTSVALRAIAKRAA